MMHRVPLGILLALATSVLLAAAMPVEVDWEPRLEGLDPRRPMAYFELGEEIADAATSPESRELARRLFGIAGRIDREGLGASAALALAALAPDRRTAARLRAVAAMQDGRRGSVGALPERPRVDATTAIGVSEAFGGFRTGRTSKLRVLLEDPEGRRLLERWDETLPGGVAWLTERSRRSARSRPDLSESEVLAMLRVEVGLLQAQAPTWSSVLDLDGDEPLLEIPVENIDEMILDGELLPYRRNGRWVATPGE